MKPLPRLPLIVLGGLQLVFGIALVAYQLWHPVHAIYVLWDRVEILISNDIFDPVRFDAYLKAHGQVQTGLTAGLGPRGPRRAVRGRLRHPHRRTGCGPMMAHGPW